MVKHTNSNHLEYIDALKGFGMFLVVMGHVIAWSFESYGSGFFVPAAKNLPVVLLWWNVIYSFHMPLLFWLSGFLFLSAKRPFAWRILPTYLWRKIYTLLVPFVVAGMVFYAITGEYFTKYWFLRTLFIFILMTLPYEVFRQRLLSGRGVLAVVSDVVYYLSVVYIVNVLSWKYRGDMVDAIFDSEHMLHYKFFIFGLLCKRYAALQKYASSNLCYTLSLVVFIWAMFLLHHTHPVVSHLSFMITIAPFAGILCAYYLFSMRFTEGSIVRAFRYIGRHSLEIYILHFYFIFSVPLVGQFVICCMSQDAFHQAMGSTTQLVYGIAGASVVCTLAVVAMKVIRTSNLLSVLLLGRLNKS